MPSGGAGPRVAGFLSYHRPVTRPEPVRLDPVPSGPDRLEPVARSAAGSALVRAARLAFLAATVGLSGYAVAMRWDEVSRHLREIGAGRAVLSVPLMFGGLYCGMRAWRSVLRGLGSDLPTPDAGRIYFVGQLGKYLPGSVWPIVAQMELGRDHGIPRRRSAAALVVALVTSLVTALIVAAGTMPFVGGQRYAVLWWLLVPVPFLAVLLHPGVLLACLRRLPVLKLGPALPAVMPTGAMATAVGWTALGWLSYGLHVAVLAAAFPAHGSGALLVAAVGGYPLAWSAGLVAFVLPAGAGARDLALVLALSAVVPTNPAIAVAVVSRAVTTGCDLALAAAAAANVGPGVRRQAQRSLPLKKYGAMCQATNMAAPSGTTSSQDGSLRSSGTLSTTNASER